jgi:hypothetical protein
MTRPAVARELFLPLDQAWWDGGRFTLGRWAKSVPRPSTRGVRLQEPGTGKSGPPAERDTQTDLCSLVDSVTELRRVPELMGIVLADETLIGRQEGAIPGKRVLFGLRCLPNDRFQADGPAAAECHRVIRRAVRRARYVIEHPKEPFLPTSGFEGLRAWAAAVRLRRKPDPRRWLLLLLLPLLFLPWSCVNNWLHTPPSPTQTAEADGAQNGSSGKSGEPDKGQKDGGAPPPPPGGGSKDSGSDKGKKPSAPPAPKPAPAPRKPAEEEGPPTTIPSKMPKSAPAVSYRRSSTNTSRFGAD